MLKIDRLDFIVGNGCTEPVFGTSSNNKIVIKYFNNVQGNKALINELVCYYIAKQLNLTMPISGLCEINEFTKVDESILELTEFGHNNHGIGFYSSFITILVIIQGFR